MMSRPKIPLFANSKAKRCSSIGDRAKRDLISSSVNIDVCDMLYCHKSNQHQIAPKDRLANANANFLLFSRSRANRAERSSSPISRV